MSAATKIARRLPLKGGRTGRKAKPFGNTPLEYSQVGALASEPELRDEDVVAVRKVFQVFGKFVNEAKGRMQVIILDHAGRDIWGDVHGVHLVEEWRNGRALVPQSWLA